MDCAYMRVHSEKHGRFDACRVSVSALFVMTSILSLLRFTPQKGGKRKISLLLVSSLCSFCGMLCRFYFLAFYGEACGVGGCPLGGVAGVASLSILHYAECSRVPFVTLSIALTFNVGISKAPPRP